MLRSVIVARDHFMMPTGTMFPSAAELFIVGIEDAEYRQKKIGFWDNVYGFSYAPIKRWALLEPLVENCPSERIITDTCRMLTYDLNRTTVDQLIINADFRLVPRVNETLHALVVWFDVAFQGPQKNVVLSTSPFKDSTHWSQSIFYLEEPIHLTTRSIFTGSFHMEPNLKNPRDQDFVISYSIDGMHYTQTYKMR
jgi:protein arginine N-methyltransferase 1